MNASCKAKHEFSDDAPKVLVPCKISLKNEVWT